MKLLATLATALGLLALSACSNMINDLTAGGLSPDGVSTANSLTPALIGAGQADLSAVKGNLLLPELGTNDTTVTWSSDTPGTVSATGVVTRPEVGAADATVTLTATITKNGVTATKTFTVKVTAIPSDPTVAITDDKATLVEAILKGPNADLNTVKGPLNLPSKGPSGTTISWASDTAGTLSSSGNVSRPAAGQPAKTVVLTATLTKSGGTQETKTFTVIVQPMSSDSATAAADDKAALTSALLAGGSPDLGHLKGPLYLPTSGPGGSSISWSSDPTGTIGTSGILTRPGIGEASKTVTLTATITNGTTTTTKTFTVTVEATPADATEAIADDQATLVDNVIKGTSQGLDVVTSDLTLPTAGPGGTAITWTSSDPGTVSTGGTITRPAVGGSPKTVTLTATVTKSGGTSETKTFTIVVQPLSSDPTEALADDKAALTSTSILGSNADTSNVTGNLTLPTSGDSGTTITWASSDTSVISTTGTVTQPTSTDATVTLTATFSMTGGTSVTKTFSVTVKASTMPVLTNGMSASLVLGQADFTSSSSGTNAKTIARPNDLVFAGGKLFVTSIVGNRVLIYNSIPTSTYQSCDVVVGQSNKTSSLAATTQSGLSAPQGVASDGTHLVVADQGNARVLIWNTIPTSDGQPADVVLGHSDYVTSGIPATSASSMDPYGVAIVGTKLLVADFSYHRVLIYNSIPTNNNQAADMVLGQSGFTTPSSANTFSSTTNSSTLRYPTQVWSDGTKVLVLDQGNNRILVWNSFPTTYGQAADVVIGQSDMSSRTNVDFDAARLNFNGSMNVKLTVDKFGRLLVAVPMGGGTAGSRIYIYNSIPTTSLTPADKVLGAPDFTSTVTGTASASTFRDPEGVAVDSTGHIWVADYIGNRVLKF
ncbi:MAG: immunoglobulin-like domain-containing protein [Spirochaetales bacterium]